MLAVNRHQDFQQFNLKWFWPAINVNLSQNFAHFCRHDIDRKLKITIAPAFVVQFLTINAQVSKHGAQRIGSLGCHQATR